MRKVLIISYYFPPINMLASKRYGTMCKYLEENGYKPYVLTTRHYEDRENGIRLEQEMYGVMLKYGIRYGRWC